VPEIVYAADAQSKVLYGEVFSKEEIAEDEAVSGEKASRGCSLG